MAKNLVVRNVDPELVHALERAEAEHREILRKALSRPPRRSFAEMLAGMPDVGTDEDFARLPNSA